MNQVTTEAPIKVRQIIEEKNGYAHVVVDQNTFSKVSGFAPQLPYTTARNGNGQGIRIFDLDGVKLYVRKETQEEVAEGAPRRQIFAMKLEDAHKYLLTLDQERENGEQVADLNF